MPMAKSHLQAHLLSRTVGKGLRALATFGSVVNARKVGGSIAVDC